MAWQPSVYGVIESIDQIIGARQAVQAELSMEDGGPITDGETSFADRPFLPRVRRLYQALAVISCVCNSGSASADAVEGSVA